MPRVYLPSIPVDKSLIEISGDNARYIASVLRLTNGAGLILFDSVGRHFNSEIKSVSPRRVEVELKEELQPVPDPPCRIILLQGILKGQKMDLIIQKATELGVSEIAPVVTERTIVRATDKITRWRKIAIEASRQSGRRIPPEVKDPSGFADFISSSSTPLNGFTFWEEKGSGLTCPLKFNSDKPIYVAVGPEGGFTAEEIAIASSGGLTTVNLGPGILRAETASITAVALIQFLSGGFNAK